MAELITTLSLVLVTFLLNLGVQTISYKIIDQDKMRGLRKESKQLRKDLFANTSKPDELAKIQKKAMDVNMEIMKLSMKPTLYTMVPFFIIFMILGQFYGNAGDMIPLPFALPIAGTALGWVGTYLLFSMMFSVVLKPLVTRVGDRLAAKKSANN